MSSASPLPTIRVGTKICMKGTGVEGGCVKDKKERDFKRVLLPLDR